MSLFFPLLVRGGKIGAIPSGDNVFLLGELSQGTPEPAAQPPSPDRGYSYMGLCGVLENRQERC